MQIITSKDNETVKNIKKLKTLGFLIRHGSPKNGYWEVTDCDTEEKDK